jgi:hypothetical protein
VRHEATGRAVELRADQVCGRAKNVDVRIDNPKVSAQHARIRWKKTHWEVSDLGSRNGTYVHQRRLEAGERVRLQRGDRLAFGDPLDEWQVVDDEPPKGTRAGRGPGVITETHQRDAAPPRVDEIKLYFSVSTDEEHVTVLLFHPGGVAELPPSNLHYLLFLLARQRLSDRENPALAFGEHGWVYGDDLCKQMQLDPSHLNVTIFRLRKQLERLGVIGAAGIIERRRTTGQVRIGVGSLSVKHAARQR